MAASKWAQRMSHPHAARPEAVSGRTRSLSLLFLFFATLSNVVDLALLIGLEVLCAASKENRVRSRVALGKTIPIGGL